MPGVGLGELYDLSTGIGPVDLGLAANTGKRLSMVEVESALVVLIKAAGTAAQDPVLTLRQHTAAVAGVSTDLATVTRFWHKSEATLDGDEVWTQVDQAAAAAVTLTGLAALEAIVAIPVRSEQLTPPNSFISLDIADTGLNIQFGTVLYVVHVTDRGVPQGLLAPLR